jgi:hypothetical protein
VRPIHEVIYYESRKREVKTIYDYNLVVYYKSRKREIKIRLMDESRCDERLKGRVQEGTCLTYTGLHDKTN